MCSNSAKEGVCNIHKQEYGQFSVQSGGITFRLDQDLYYSAKCSSL